MLVKAIFFLGFALQHADAKTYSLKDAIKKNYEDIRISFKKISKLEQKLTSNVLVKISKMVPFFGS